MKLSVLNFLRHLISHNKKLILLTAAYIILVFLYFQKLKKLKEEKQLKRKAILMYKLRLILKELEIEANFTLNIAFLKYKDKNMLNKEKKRD